MISLFDAEYFYDSIWGIYSDKALIKRKKLFKLYDIFKEFIDLLLINDSQYFSSYYSMLIYIVDKYKLNKSLSGDVFKFRSFVSTVKRDRSRIINYSNINFGLQAIISFIDYFTEPDAINWELTKKIDNYKNMAYVLASRIPRFKNVESELKDFIRVICIEKNKIEVESGKYLNALAFEGEIGEKFYLVLNKIWEDAYLYFRKGSTANLLHITKSDIKSDLPCWKPTEHSFIVYEPDYLMDITEIAECFVHNGWNKYIHLINKFKLSESGYSLLKGNVINSYLDQLVDDIDTGFEEAYEYAIKQKPISVFAFAIKDPDQSRILKDETRSHFDNIRNALIELQYSNIIVEPTFISPLFGLQGRLDLLAESDDENSKNVIELKSGRAPDKDYSITIGNKLRVKTGVWNNHSAQATGYNLLLDSAYPNRSGSSGILYSSLEIDNLRNQPNIHANKRELIKLRNWLTAIDVALSNGAGSMLRYMFKDKPDANLSSFNIEDLRKFQLGYSSMSELTREYFESNVTFIAREIRTVKTGEDGNSGRSSQSSLWLMSMEEKLESYNTIPDLKIDNDRSDFNNFHLLFIRNIDSSVISNIRRGDLVVIYPQADDYVVTNNQVIKGYIKEIDNEVIRISLRNKQIKKDYFSKYNDWIIESDINDSINKKLYQSLFAFCKGDERKLNTVLGLREPEFESVKDYKIEGLNEQQNQLLNRALAAKDYFIIQGPPGTGKTSKMMKSLVEILYSDTEEKILVAAYTNRAVDEICSKLKEIDGIEFYRLGSKESTEHTDTLIASLVEKESPRTVFKKVANTRIIVSTVASLIYNPEIFEIISFDTAIIDEASQILEPYTLPIINNVGRFIMIGDEKQLPAIVTQDSKYLKVNNEKMQEISLKSLDSSLFERLLEISVIKRWECSIGMLEYQARMDYEIQELVNYMFYGGRLKALETTNNDNSNGVFNNSSENNIEKLLSNSNVVFIDVKPEDNLQFKHNSEEARLAAEISGLIHEKYGSEFNEQTLGIIATFRAQCAEIRSLLPENIRGLVTVDTVERFQGSERENIIISFAINRAFELRNISSPVILNGIEVDRKLNVAITRAKKRLIMIGNSDILKQSLVYAKMLGYLGIKNL
jgi:DNA replication ATP-dependent helicase Dna2